MNTLKGKKVLVTGADGFIGSHLVETLINQGAKVRALVYYNSWGSWGFLQEIKNVGNECEIVVGDIRDSHFCLNLVQDQEIVFHLAALIDVPYSYVASGSFFETNILGTVNLLEAAKREKNLEKFVHTSTSETYGTALYSPIDEKHELQAQSPYAASKVGADKAAMSYFLSFGLPVTIVRPFNTYGPRQSARGVIPTIITQLLSDQMKKVRLGSLKPIRDYTYVTDTARAFILAALYKNTIGEVLNVGSGQGYSIKEIYDMTCDILGTKKDVVTDLKRLRPSKSEVWKLVCDNSKIKSLTGFEPQTNFRDGLVETIAWIRNNLSKYRPEIYNI